MDKWVKEKRNPHLKNSKTERKRKSNHINRCHSGNLFLTGNKTVLWTVELKSPELLYSKYVRDSLPKELGEIFHELPYPRLRARDLTRFSYEDLMKFTNDFNTDNFAGRTKSTRGGVYKGIIQDIDKKTRSKTLIILFTDPEIRTWSNVPRLLGYFEDDSMRGLVYDCRPQITLFDAIDKDSFTWKMRVKVAIQLANFVFGLHNYMEPPIIAFNWEPHSVMIDENYDAKVFDIGRATGGILGERADTKHYIFNTKGYCDAQTLASGQVSRAVDVFSFGAILLSLVSMKQGVVGEKGIHQWARKKAKLKGKNSIVHPGFSDQCGFYKEDAIRLARIGIKCTMRRKQLDARPTIDKVVEHLRELLLRSWIVLVPYLSSRVSLFFFFSFLMS